MFRRVYWFTIGTAVGLGGSWWVTRYVRQTVARYAPERIQADMGDKIRGLGSDVRRAVAEGRQAMVEREAELRGSDPANGRTLSRADGGRATR